MAMETLSKTAVDDGHARRIIAFAYLHVWSCPSAARGSYGTAWKTSHDQVTMLGPNGKQRRLFSMWETQSLSANWREKISQSAGEIWE